MPVGAALRSTPLSIYALRYLTAFECRHNRRFELKEDLGRLAPAAAAIKPQPCRSIIGIRPSGRIVVRIAFD